MTLFFHPAKDRPKTALVLTFFLGVAMQALWQWLAPAVALTLWSVLCLSLRDFFCPTLYNLDPDGFTISGPARVSQNYPWRRFRTYLVDRNGIFLSPYRQQRALENHRGVFLPLTVKQREQVANYCSKLGLEKQR